jgi:hypothetical protein
MSVPLAYGTARHWRALIKPLVVMRIDLRCVETALGACRKRRRDTHVTGEGAPGIGDLRGYR